MRGCVVTEHTLEPREIARPRGGDERIQQAALLRRTHRRAASVRYTCPCSGDKLPRVGFFHTKKVCDLPVPVAERLSKHERRALG
jgi:hypothetical protein